MLYSLRRYIPFLIGSGVLLLGLDLLILLYRALGLDKGAAIYAALVTVSGVGYALIRRNFKQDRVSAAHQPTEHLGNE